MAQVADAIEWIGEFRSPRNSAAEVKGSIHDDATASMLGFKGGTVAGSIHMDQFVPKLVDIYGERWFRDGSISLYFTQATVDREKVRAALYKGTFKSPIGDIEFDEGGYAFRNGAYPMQMQNGKVVIVWPPEKATGKMQWPSPAWQ